MTKPPFPRNCGGFLTSRSDEERINRRTLKEGIVAVFTQGRNIMKYIVRKPTEREQMEIELVLLEQMEIQSWYVVTVLSRWKQEIYLTLN